MRLKKLNTRIVFGILALFFMVSCNNEISDFFESIRDNGYRSTKPLGPEKVKVDDAFLGGYVYKSLPVIISQKTNYLYEINFLSTNLYKEDRVVEAHITKLGGFTFMNLKMGDYFCFLKFNILYEEELEVDLVKSGLKKHITETQLKSWLSKNADKGQYQFKDEDGEEREMNAFYSFTFKKITTARAFEIQKGELNSAKEALFKDCYSYSRYDELVALYPEEEFKIIGQYSLFKKCSTLYEYETYITNFPNSKFSIEAEKEIERIKEEEARRLLIEKDRINYELASEENTIESLEKYLEIRKTEFYVDTTMFQIKGLVQKITVEDIEWKWVGGEKERALQYIFYKIDYVEKLSDINWIIEHMSFYAIKLDSVEIKEKTLAYMDILFERNISADARLNLFMEKGFLLWSMGKNDMAVNSFGLKINSKYQMKSITFKENLKIRYNFYKEKNKLFPEQKGTWKRIKKLK